MQQFFCKALAFAPVQSLTATPIFSPVPGTYTSPQTVSITSQAGSTIFYTLDGSTPTTASTVYSGPISVTASETILAIATATGFLTSQVGGGTYTLNIVIVATYVNEGYGAVSNWFIPNGAQTVALPAGVDPGDLLLLLSGTFLGTINPPAVTGWTLLTSTYTNHSLGLWGRIATGTGDAPTIDWGVSHSTFAAGVTACYSGNPATLTGIVDQFANLQTNSNSAINYPGMNVGTDNCLVIGGGILNLDATTNEAGGTFGNINTGGFVVKAQANGGNSHPALAFNEWIQATKTNFASAGQIFSIQQSAQQSTGAFTISLVPGQGLPPQANAPTFSPAAGTYTSTQSVTLSSTTSSASIYYTLDGSTPTFPITGTTQLYTGPISVAATETIQALANSASTSNSSIVSATYTISSVSLNYKFNPGDYAMTLQYQHNVTLAFATTDINALNTHKPTTGPVGYVMGANWAAVETGAQVDNPTFNQGILNTQYPGFAVWEQIFNQLQATIPGAHMGISIMANQYGKSFSGSTITSANWGNGQFIPSYIANCGGNLTVPNGYGATTHTTYPVAPIYAGSSFYGLAFDTLVTPQPPPTPPPPPFLSTAIPAFWNPGVNQAFINFLQAASHYVFQSGPRAGLTIDQIPEIEFLLFNDEWSYNLGSSQNVPGVNVNPPNFTNTINQPTVANAIAAYKLMFKSACAAFPHTLCATNTSFTFGAAQSAASTAGMVNDKISQTGTSLSTTIGLALCAADTFCTDWTSAGGANYAKQGYVGVASPAFGSTIVATSNTQKGIMPIFAQIQPADYHIHLTPGATAYTASVVQALTQSADNAYIQATHRIWCMGDDVQTGGSQGAWTGYVQPALNAGTGIAPFSTVVPSSIAATSAIGINGQWWANNSVWNVPIPSGAFAAAFPNSATIMAAYKTMGGGVTSAFRPQKQTFTTAGPIVAPAAQATIRWTVPYNGGWSMTAVPCTGAVSTTFINDYNYFAGQGDTDGHIAIFSTDQQVMYSIYSGTTQGAGGTGPKPVLTGAPFPLTNGGWWNNNLFATLSSGPASGAANSGGVIRPSEWNAGIIQHAIATVFPGARTGVNANSPDSPQAFIFPARASDGANNGASFLPEGARLQLDPSLSDATLLGLGVPNAMLPVCHALQTYGAYDIDVAGPFPNQIKFFSDLGGATQYPNTADLPMAIIDHLAWIPGPYLVGSGAKGPGVTITGTSGQFAYTKNYGSGDGLVHVGDTMSVYIAYPGGGDPGTGTITGWNNSMGGGTTYKVSVASASTFTLTNLDGSAIVTAPGASGTINAYFTTCAPLDNVFTAEASGLLVQGP